MKVWHKHVAVAILATAVTYGVTRSTAPLPPGPPVLELPATVKTQVGRQVKIAASTSPPGLPVQWQAPGGCELTPSETGAYAVFTTNIPGRHVVTAWTAKSGKPTGGVTCEVEADGASPGPQPPAPIPAPSVLVAKLQAAYALDKQPVAQKTEQKVLLVGIYQAVAVKSADKSVKSTKDLMAQLRTAMDGLMRPDSLLEVRSFVAGEARLQFGDTPAPLDDGLRTRLVVFWQGMADALKVVR